MDGNARKVERADLVFPELSYRILGVLFDVLSEVGPGHKEKVYQRAVAKAFQENKFSVHEQLPAKILYRGKQVGIYYFDFLIDDKIVLELKVRDYFSKKDIEQVYSYLKVRNLKLGIIAHFTKSGVKYKRILNIR